MQNIGKIDSDYLYTTRVIIDTIQNNTDIASALATYGYDATRIQEGLELYNNAEQAFRVLLKLRQERQAKYENMKLLYKQLQVIYNGHISRLRKWLADDPAAYAQLKLGGRRKKSKAGYIEECNHFYGMTLNVTEIAAKILPFGFTPEVLQEGLTALQDYQASCIEYETVAGECQKLAVERDKAFRRLRRWIGTLAASCKVAFADNLQTLEEIGFFVRNRPKAKSETPPEETNTETVENQDIQNDAQSS